MNHLIYPSTGEPVKLGDTVPYQNSRAIVGKLPYGLHGHVSLLDLTGKNHIATCVPRDLGMTWQYPHRTPLYDDSTVQYKGLTFTVSFTADTDCDEPWNSGDGYGIVSEWTSRGKRPGERLLDTSGRNGTYRRYYDWAATIQKAKDESWDAEPYGVGTKGEHAVRATQADFEYMQAWCNDEWNYVVVRVECDEAVEQHHSVETYKDYHMDEAWEMIEAMAEDVLKLRADEAKVKDELQSIAQAVWDDANGNLFAHNMDEAFVVQYRTNYNRILLAAGLQPIADKE